MRRTSLALALLASWVAACATTQPAIVTIVATREELREDVRKRFDQGDWVGLFVALGEIEPRLSAEEGVGLFGSSHRTLRGDGTSFLVWERSAGSAAADGTETWRVGIRQSGPGPTCFVQKGTITRFHDP